MIPSNFTIFNPAEAVIDGFPIVERRLSQLAAVFADDHAYDAAREAQQDPLIYTVSSVSPAEGAGQLHYGLGQIMPGKIGREYYMTRGHYHEWRAAAEIYIGLSGVGFMLLEAEEGGEGELVPLRPNSIVYVPGHTAHRTINTGLVPLTYLGIYPAEAGHDYASLAKTNFRHVVIDVDGQPTMLLRESFLAQLHAQKEGHQS